MKIRAIGAILSLAAVFFGDFAFAELTPSQLASVVVIKGESGSGTGFISTLKGKNFVITNQHVIDGQSKISIANSNGVSFTGTSFIAATDLDIVLIGIGELPASIVPLPLSSDATKTAKAGDMTLIPGNSKGDGVITVTPGKVIAFGPKKIEVDNPVYAGNSGSPIIHEKSGEVIGILTEAELVELDPFAAASFRNKNSQIKSSIRYFGHRVDQAKGWEKLDWQKFSKYSEEAKRGREELLAVFRFMVDSSSSNWKEFEDLHSARNKAFTIIKANSYSQTEKQAARSKFVSELEWICKSPVERLKSQKIYYIHRSKLENINFISERLLAGVEILHKDVKLINELVQRDGD